MGTQKRERQKSNRAARLEAEQKALARQKATQRMMLFGVLGLFVVGVLYLISRGGGQNEFEPAAVPTTIAATTTAVTDPPPAMEGATECPAADGSSEQILQFTEAPPMCIDPSKTYSAVVETNKGTITIDLDAANAPETVNNFVVLARYHYYDDVAFHRIIPGFVVQGGDPVGQPAGTGNPGYRFEDELPTDGYQIGSVAMANSGPNTNGSQFFIVTGEQGVNLPLSYSNFGMISEGLDVASALEAAGSAAGTPTEDVRIISVTINES